MIRTFAEWNASEWVVRVFSRTGRFVEAELASPTYDAAEIARLERVGFRCVVVKRPGGLKRVRRVSVRTQTSGRVHFQGRCVWVEDRATATRLGVALARWVPLRSVSHGVRSALMSEIGRGQVASRLVDVC